MHVILKHEFKTQGIKWAITSGERDTAKICGGVISSS